MLSSDRVTLRPVEPADVDILYQWENDTEVWHVGNTVAPYSRKILWEYIESYEADIFKTRQLRFIIELNDGKIPVGTIDLYDFDPINSRCGVGVLVIPPYRSMGVATECIDLVAEYCRKRLSLHQLYCTIAVSNAPSLAAFKNVGFNVSGKLKSWMREGGCYEDALILQKLL